MSNKEIENLPICLLAAAPAMLEALEACLGCLQMECDECPGCTTDPCTQCRAKAAIRLAKGESHV